MLFFWFFKNCELIRDSSLWHSNFIFLVRDSIIITGSRCYTYTFGSRFNYEHWVRVSIKNLNFRFLGQVFQYCLLGLKVCRLRFASFGFRAHVLKLVFYSFIFCFLFSSYLVPFMFFIPRSYFVMCTWLKSCTKLQQKKKKKKNMKKEKKRRHFRKEIQNRKKKKFLCRFSSLRPKYCLLV